MSPTGLNISSIKEYKIDLPGSFGYFFDFADFYQILQIFTD